MVNHCENISYFINELLVVPTENQNISHELPENKNPKQILNKIWLIPYYANKNRKKVTSTYAAVLFYKCIELSMSSIVCHKN